MFCATVNTVNTVFGVCIRGFWVCMMLISLLFMYPLIDIMCVFMMFICVFIFFICVVGRFYCSTVARRQKLL